MYAAGTAIKRKNSCKMAPKNIVALTTTNTLASTTKTIAFICLLTTFDQPNWDFRKTAPTMAPIVIAAIKIIEVFTIFNPYNEGVEKPIPGSSDF
jgi:hypothetical protein